MVTSIGLLFFLSQVGTACEHLGFSVALHVPTVVVVTKVDLCQREEVERTVKQVEELLKSPGCTMAPLRIGTKSDVCTAAQVFVNDT